MFPGFNSYQVDRLRQAYEAIKADPHPTQAMSEEQEDHLARLNTAFVNYNSVKYEQGTREHPGLLSELDVLTQLYNIRDEAVDTFNYAQSAIDAIEAKEAKDTSAKGNGASFL
jgi:hypothetical protein